MYILSLEVNSMFYVIFEAKSEFLGTFRSYKRVKAWRNSLRPLKYVKRSLLVRRCLTMKMGKREKNEKELKRQKFGSEI